MATTVVFSRHTKVVATTGDARVRLTVSAFCLTFYSLAPLYIYCHLTSPLTFVYTYPNHERRLRVQGS